MEASDLHENCDRHPIPIYPSIPHGPKEAGLVDINLSVSSNCITLDKLCRRGSSGKEVEIIDLEVDCIQDDKALNNPDQKYVFCNNWLFQFSSEIRLF